MRALVLASRSPQRRAILEQLGIEFSVVVSEVEELVEGPPRLVAVENARRKASAVSAAGSVVLGVDTVVSLGSRIYDKPADADDARATLLALSGRTHTVTSGICLVDPDGRMRTAAAATLVRFRTLDGRLLDWFLESGEWRDRAGAYAIQGHGAALVERIEGDYWNVVGLPVPTLLDVAGDVLLGP
jgi:septum formation protein